MAVSASSGLALKRLPERTKPNSIGIDGMTLIEHESRNERGSNGASTTAPAFSPASTAELVTAPATLARRP
jgi:hypothetical protein